MIPCLSDRMGIEAWIPVHRVHPRRSDCISIPPAPETARPYMMGPKRFWLSGANRYVGKGAALPDEIGYMRAFSLASPTELIGCCSCVRVRAGWVEGMLARWIIYGSVVRSISIQRRFPPFDPIDRDRRESQPLFRIPSIRGKANRTDWRELFMLFVHAWLVQCSVGRRPGACGTPPRVGSSIQELVGGKMSAGWSIDPCRLLPIRRSVRSNSTRSDPHPSADPIPHTTHLQAQAGRRLLS